MQYTCIHVAQSQYTIHVCMYVCMCMLTRGDTFIHYLQTISKAYVLVLCTTLTEVQYTRTAGLFIHVLGNCRLTVTSMESKLCWLINTITVNTRSPVSCVSFVFNFPYAKSQQKMKNYVNESVPFERKEAYLSVSSIGKGPNCDVNEVKWHALFPCTHIGCLYSACF